MKYKFIALNGVKQTHDSFKGAFKAMFDWVKAQFAAGGISLQVLETAIWIETPEHRPIYFYDARDLAIDLGILVDGKFVE